MVVFKLLLTVKMHFSMYYATFFAMQMLNYSYLYLIRLFPLDML